MTTLAYMQPNKIEQALLKVECIKKFFKLPQMDLLSLPALRQAGTTDDSFMVHLAQCIADSAVEVAMIWCAKMLGLRTYNIQDLRQLLIRTPVDQSRVYTIVTRWNSHSGKKQLGRYTARRGVILITTKLVQRILEEAIPTIANARKLQVRIEANRKLDRLKGPFQQLVSRAPESKRSTIKNVDKKGVARDYREPKDQWRERKWAMVEGILDKLHAQPARYLEKLIDQAAPNPNPKATT